MTLTEAFILPDLRTGWPFQSIKNPHYDPVTAASLDRQWVEEMKAFDFNAEETYRGIQIFLLAALIYPKVDASELRDGAHLLNCGFMIDDIMEKLDSTSAREYTTYLTGIFRDPSKPYDLRMPLGNITATFWSKCLEYAHPISTRRVADGMISLFEAGCEEAEDLDHPKRVRSIDEYLELRRRTIAMEAYFPFIVVSKNLPDSVLRHPHVESLTVCATDVVLLSNDIFSFNHERSLGVDHHNMVTVVMVEKGLDVQGAVDFVAEWYQNEATKFLDGMKRVPSFGEAIDPVLGEYISGLADWITGWIEWAFVTERYFGVEGPKLRMNRVLEIVPRKPAERFAMQR